MAGDGADDEVPVFDLGDLDRAIAEVYGGPLTGFVRRRDALVKQLRAAGRPDDARRVKALRKPRIGAWALDALALAEPGEAERLAGAVATMAQAQAAPGGDVRRATTQLRVVVNEVAAGAARVAAESGHEVEAASLVPALLTVAGEPEALAELRAGRLVDIPTASGMGLLAAPPPGATTAPLHAVPDLAPDQAPETGEAPDADDAVDDEVVAAAQRKLDGAEAAQDAAQAEADAADDAVRAAAADAEAAEDRLRQAEQDVRASRSTLREAQRDARGAAQRLRETERATARARAALDALLTRSPNH